MNKTDHPLGVSKDCCETRAVAPPRRTRLRTTTRAPKRHPLPSLLLCQEIDVGGVVQDGRGRLEEVPDAAGEVALEAAQCFAVGLAFAAFAFQVGLGFGVA